MLDNLSEILKTRYRWFFATGLCEGDCQKLDSGLIS